MRVQPEVSDWWGGVQGSSPLKILNFRLLEVQFRAVKINRTVGAQINI